MNDDANRVDFTCVWLKSHVHIQAGSGHDIRFSSMMIPEDGHQNVTIR